MNGKTILRKIERNEPLSEKEIEYCRKWYENLLKAQRKEYEKEVEREQLARELLKGTYSKNPIEKEFCSNILKSGRV